jgi:hypothetical protein
MLEVIALIFIAKEIKKLALQKGLKPGVWKAYAFICWFVFEIMGFILGMLLFGNGNLWGLIFFALICAFGGFLLIRFLLMQKPDILQEDDINRIGIDDLRP